MLESIKTLLGNAAENDLPGLVESIIAALTLVPVIFAFFIKIAGFTYSEHIDRIFWTKKQQRDNWAYENVITAVVFTLVLIAIVTTKELRSIFIVVTVLGFLPLLIAIIVFIYWQYKRKSIKHHIIDVAIAIFLFAFIAGICIILSSIAINTETLQGGAETESVSEYKMLPEEPNTEQVTNSNTDQSSLGLIFKVLCICFMAAIIYEIVLNIIWNHKNCSKVYIENIKDIKDNKGNKDLEGKWYIYFSIDSDTFLCGNSPEQHASDKFVLVSKDKIVNENVIIEINSEGEKADLKDKPLSDEEAEKNNKRTGSKTSHMKKR